MPCPEALAGTLPKSRGCTRKSAWPALTNNVSRAAPKEGPHTTKQAALAPPSHAAQAEPGAFLAKALGPLHRYF
jgi:hypothetical protein